VVVSVGVIISLAKCGASNSIEANIISNTKLAKYEIIYYYLNFNFGKCCSK
jgi:hypothetical protein